MGLRLKEQQSPAALGAKTLWAAGLLPVAGVGSVVTARGGDAPPSPPCPPPKSLAAGPHGVFGQALGSCRASPGPVGRGDEREDAAGRIRSSRWRFTDHLQSAANQPIRSGIDEPPAASYPFACSTPEHHRNTHWSMS